MTDQLETQRAFMRLHQWLCARGQFVRARRLEQKARNQERYYRRFCRGHAR